MQRGSILYPANDELCQYPGVSFIMRAARALHDLICILRSQSLCRTSCHAKAQRDFRPCYRVEWPEEGPDGMLAVHDLFQSCSKVKAYTNKAGPILVTVNL